MIAKKLYEKATGRKAPDHQLPYGYIHYVGWLEHQVEALREKQVEAWFKRQTHKKRKPNQ